VRTGESARTLLTGTEGFLEVDYIRQSVQRFETAGELVKGQPWDFYAVSRESQPVDIPVARKEPLAEELAHFVSCVRTGATPATDATSPYKASTTAETRELSLLHL